MSRLYKYRANILKDAVRRDTVSLLKGELFAGLLNSLNDPFEGSVKLPNSNSEGCWVNPLIQGSERVGIYSLAKQKEREGYPSNELMWSLYANEHRGFCIEYDKDKLISCTEMGFDVRSIINVVYQDQCPDVNKSDGIYDIQRKVFGTKSLAWEHENELRIVFETYGFKPVSRDAVTGVYLGLRMGEVERGAIVKGLEGLDIPVFQMIRSNENYSIKPVRVGVPFDYEILRIDYGKAVTNYQILYKSENTDELSLKDFVEEFRREHPGQSNITIVDDASTLPIIDKGSGVCTEDELTFMQHHWIGYSTFEVPSSLWYYPEMWTWH